MTTISLESVNLCRASIGFDSILFEEQLEANEVLAKKINFIQNRTIVKHVARLSTGSAGLTGIKVLVGGWRINTAVLQSFEMIKTCRDGDIMWIVVVERD